MKTHHFTILTVIVIAIIATVLLPYIFMFPTSLSRDSSDWADFGSYFGGVLSPIIAAFALIGLGITINQQGKQLASLTQQLQLTQLENTIRSIENDFNSCLNGGTFTFSGQTYTYIDLLMHAAISIGEQAIPPLNSLTEKRELLTDDQIILVSAISSAAGHLNQLRLYVNEHRKLSGNNIISKYYERKYHNAVVKLSKLGYWEGDKPWYCT